jgi:hypothetical protein
MHNGGKQRLTSYICTGLLIKPKTNSANALQRFGQVNCHNKKNLKFVCLR